MQRPRLSLPQPFGEREAFEAEARGYLSHAVVQLPEGSVPVVFYDVVRLGQDLEEESKAGLPFIAEPGLIVLESVTRANMEAAVERLFDEGFFEHFRVTDRP